MRQTDFKKMSRTAQYISGMLAGLPVIIGFVFVAIAFAIMAVEAGIPAWQTVLMSAMVFAGSSQMIAVTMLTQGAGIVTIVLATFIINLRHLIMSTCVMNRLKGVPRRAAVLAAFGITDESFAIFTTTAEEKTSLFFLLGLITVTYSSWVAGTALGCAAMQFLPDFVSKSMGITLYAMFIGLLVPNVKGDARIRSVVLITASLSFFFSRFMTAAWTIIFATLIGAAVGIFIVGGRKASNIERDREMELAE